MNTETMRRVYQDAQKSCGIKVGDFVAIERKAEDYEAGWNNVWPRASKTDFVGEFGKVAEITEYSIGVLLGDGTIFYFPYFVLKPAADHYIAQQNACGLKVGDKVKVIGKAVHGEKGWQDGGWSVIKDALIGKIGFIKEDHLERGYLVSFSDRAWHFPYFCLEKVKESEYEFKPFDRVLVRDKNTDPWVCGFFSYYLADRDSYKYRTCFGLYEYCIPYEGNEHLVNTTEDPKGEE